MGKQWSSIFVHGNQSNDSTYVRTFRASVKTLYICKFFTLVEKWSTICACDDHGGGGHSKPINTSGLLYYWNNITTTDYQF